MFLFMIVFGFLSFLMSVFYVVESFSDYVREARERVEGRLVRVIDEKKLEEAYKEELDLSWGGEVVLEEFCKKNGFGCKRYRWEISIEDEGKFFYKKVKVYDWEGRLVYEVDNLREVASRYRMVDNFIGTLCTQLYRYQVNMREKANYDANFFAREDSPFCMYDGSNVVFDNLAGFRVEKEIKCSRGMYKSAGELGLDKVLFGYDLSGVEFNNSNVEVVRKCGVGRDKIVVRRLINEWNGVRKYLEACCG